MIVVAAKMSELYADLAREAYKPFGSVLMRMPSTR